MKLLQPQTTIVGAFPGQQPHSKRRRSPWIHLPLGEVPLSLRRPQTHPIRPRPPWSLCPLTANLPMLPSSLSKSAIASQNLLLQATLPGFPTTTQVKFYRESWGKQRVWGAGCLPRPHRRITQCISRNQEDCAEGLRNRFDVLFFKSSRPYSSSCHHYHVLSSSDSFLSGETA